MEVGKLNKRIELQLNSEETSAYTTSFGGLTTTWATASTVWASIRPLSGRELFIAQQAQSDANYEIRIRYYTGLDTFYRIKFGTRYFQILSVLNTDEHNEEMLLQCKEVKGDV
jgi:SPP1 family predicted phage head-tail adaptor